MQNQQDWSVNTLRFTAFPVANANFLQATWWIDLIGQPPETEIFQAKVGVKHFDGTIGNNTNLILELAPQRIDWLMTGVEANNPIPLPGISVLGDFVTVVHEFANLINRWFQLETVPGFHRIALGSVLSFPVRDRVDGYHQLERYLPNVRIDAENSTDFMYQINRPRPSRTGIPGLTINRLSKFGVMTGFLIPITPGIIRADQGFQDFACRLELDVNTAADYPETITRDQARSVFQELVDLSIELSQRGDVP